LVGFAVAAAAILTIPHAPAGAAPAPGLGIPDLPSRAERALAAVVRTYGPNVVYSRVLVTAGGTLALVEHGLDDQHDDVDVLSYEGGAWQRRTTLSVPSASPPGTPLPTGVLGPDDCSGNGGFDYCMQFAPLTGPDSADMVVPVPLGVHEWVFVVDLGAATPRFVPFAAPGAAPDEGTVADSGIDLQGDALVTTTSSCVPDCASGSPVSTVWRYSAPAQSFVAVGAPAAAPPARSGAAMAYDAATHQVVLYGGIGNPATGNPFLSDTWTWDGSEWHEAASSGPGSEAGGAQIAYDGATGQLLLLTSPSEGAQAPSYYTTSVWSGSAWVAQAAPANLPARTAGGTDAVGGLVYQPSTSQLIVVLVDNSPQPSTQTWSWDGHTWQQLHPATEPPPELGPVAYDGTTGLVVDVAPGLSGPNGPSPATWVWDGTNWSDLAPAHHPPTSLGSALAYDPAQQDLVLFGGSPGGTGGGCSSDTDRWIWDGHDWSQADPPADVAGRADASMAYDDASGQLLLFGGCEEVAGQPDLLQDTEVLEAGTPAGSTPSAPADTEPTDCGTGVAASVEPDWVHKANEKLAEKANQLFGIPVATITLPAGLYLNLSPAFDPGEAKLCAVNVVGDLVHAWDGGQLEVDTDSQSGSSSPAQFVYSALSTAWTLAPGAPPAPPNPKFETSFQPQPEFLPGADLDLTSKGLSADLTLFDVKFVSLKATWQLVLNHSQAFTVELGPSLVFQAQISKENLLKQLSDDLETSGSESTAVDEVSQQVADDEAVAAGADGEGFFGLSTAQIEQRLDATISDEMKQALSDFLDTLGPGPDAKFLEDQGVTADEVSGDAAATLEADEAAAFGDALFSVACDLALGGPEDPLGDAACLK
jgi:hypothetical protein